MDRNQDAFGRAVLESVRGHAEPEILERDDDFIETGAGPDVYLTPYEEWPGVERQAMRYARGVVDVGCSAERGGSPFISRATGICVRSNTYWFRFPRRDGVVVRGAAVFPR